MIVYHLMTISHQFASVFPIKSMACVVSLSIWSLKTISPYIIRSSLPILLTVIQSDNFCSNRSLYMLEKVNKKAIRDVLNDYVSTYRDLLDKVSKPTLYVARLKAIAIEAYKCYVNENPQYIDAMFDSVDKPYNLRGVPLAEQPKVKTTSSGLNTFTYQAAKIWNSLPSHYKEASSLSDFKQHILKWPGPDCQCGCCALCRSYDVWSLCT